MEEEKKCKIQFKYKYNGSKYDEVGVVGNLNELSNWNNNNPVNLEYSEEEKLFKSGEIQLSHNINFEYKYVFFTNNEHKWEVLPYNMNRKVEIKNEKSLILKKTEVENIENKKEDKKEEKKEDKEEEDKEENKINEQPKKVKKK